jgi:hypothetical protein
MSASPPRIRITGLLFCCSTSWTRSRIGAAKYASETIPRTIKMIPTIDAVFMRYPCCIVSPLLSQVVDRKADAYRRSRYQRNLSREFQIRICSPVCLQPITVAISAVPLFSVARIQSILLRGP